MPRRSLFASLTVSVALACGALFGSAVSMADGGASVSIHEGGDATSWGYTQTTATIQAGETVTWTNAGALPHDAAATDGSWKVPLLNTGASASYTFTTPGTYTYICTPHPWMLGTIVVTAAAAAPAPTAVPADTAAPPPADTTAPPPDDGSGG